MSFTIKQRFIHMAPRKLRLVADTVRGKNTDIALNSLVVLPKIAAQPIAAAIKSAVNAAKQGKVTGNLVVTTIFVDEGPAMKRRIFKSRGRATPMEHRMSHVTVTVDEIEPSEKPQRKTSKTKVEA